MCFSTGRLRMCPLLLLLKVQQVVQKGRITETSVNIIEVARTKQVHHDIKTNCISRKVQTGFAPKTFWLSANELYKQTQLCENFFFRYDCTDTTLLTVGLRRPTRNILKFSWSRLKNAHRKYLGFSVCSGWLFTSNVCVMFQNISPYVLQVAHWKKYTLSDGLLTL